MKRFETGKIYTCRSVCNNDCVFGYEILKRTDKTVTIKCHGKAARRKVLVSDGAEFIFPQGQYSMAPVLRA